MEESISLFSSEPTAALWWLHIKPVGEATAHGHRCDDACCKLRIRTYFHPELCANRETRYLKQIEIRELCEACSEVSVLKVLSDIRA